MGKGEKGANRLFFDVCVKCEKNIPKLRLGSPREEIPSSKDHSEIECGSQRLKLSVFSVQQTPAELLRVTGIQ